MHVLLHCNGGPEIGVGHVVRSVALAEEALASGHRVTFVGEYLGKFVFDLVKQTAADVRAVDRSDKQGLVSVIAEASPDVVHLDTYDDVPVATTADRPLLSNLEDGEFGRRPADLVVDPNLGSQDEPRASRGEALLLRGSRYAPLRKAVRSNRGAWRLREEAGRVLVLMGGADPRNLTPRVLDALAATNRPLHVTAVTPSEPPRVVSRGLMQVELVAPRDDLPGMLRHYDLVVSAAGTTVWELCCLGVPTALVCAADNQRAGYGRVLAAGAAVGLGSDLSGGGLAKAVRMLEETLGNPGTRASLARRAARLVDGFGATRIVRAWEQLTGEPTSKMPERAVGVRPATVDDTESLLRWRNDPATRASSRDSTAVNSASHAAWLTASLDREDRLLLIATVGGEGVGTVRWDRLDDGVWEVSITVAPHRRGQGYAGLILGAGENALRRVRQDTHALRATVHEGNEASKRLFLSAGYLLEGSADKAGFLLYRKTLPA